MSIWKSPVFYFGVVLALVVTAALAAPYVVPWNNYRADIENFGEKLTGRDVLVGGDIAVKLFPWPQLQAQQVAIGNPLGFSDGAFVRADVVKVRLSLAGLFNGALNVESVEAVKPVVNLQRNASGDVNWLFEPQQQVVGSGLLSRVKLDQIVLSGGVLSFDDLQHGHSGLLTGVNALLSADNILGPWRMRGEARLGDVPMTLSVTTSEKKKSEALKFGIKLAPLDLAFPQVALEGSWSGRQFDGGLRIDAQQATGEKTSAEGALKPLSMQAKVTATPDRMSLLKIRIAPADKKDSGTLIEGDAVVEFGTQSIVQLDLKSPRINLDTLVGGGAMQQWRDGGLLQVANQLLANLPAKMVADYKLSVSVLTSGGQALNDVRLAGSVQKEAIRVREFAAEFPGRSIGIFDGVIFSGEKAAQLGGKFRFESADTRAFMSWLMPTWRSDFEKHWTGSRGRLEVLGGDVNWTAQNFSVSNVNYRFDAVPGRASYATTSGAVPVVEVKIDTDKFDFDNLLPNGLSLLRDGGFPTVAQAIVSPDGIAPVERHVTLRGAAMRLNGVAAQNVAIEFSTGAKGFDLKTFEIGDVSGARLAGGGRLVDEGDGPQGDLNFTLQAQDPRGFLRLVGLEYGNGQWTEALGQTQLEAKITAVPQKSGPELKIVTRGSSGALNMELVSTLRELTNGRGAIIAASGGVNAADSAVLARLLGVVTKGVVGPGDVRFEFNGSTHEGFVFATTVKALDAIAKLEGTAQPQQAYFGMSGKFSAKADDGRALLQALGVPIVQTAGQPLDVSLLIAAKDNGLALIDIVGNAGGRRLSGSAALSADGRLQADFETDTLDVREALAMVFMPWDGPSTDLGNGFADVAGGVLQGEVFIKPLQFESGTADASAETVVAFGFDAKERLLSISSPGEQGIKADIALKPRGESFEFSGAARWPIKLEDSVSNLKGGALARGNMLVEGSFAGEGRSPAAVLAALNGQGHYGLTDAALPRLTLDGFATSVTTADTPVALAAALLKLDQAPGTVIGQHIGNFQIAGGEVVFSPVTPKLENLSVTLVPRLDLTTGNISLATSIGLTAREELPPVTVTYAGPSGDMAVRSGTSALAAKLGYELLSKEMAQLEKLQQEQQALLAKEEAQRAEDVKRFDDYQATRSELREQARVRRFHAVAREARAAVIKQLIDEAIASSAANSRADLQKHARRLAVRRAR